MYHEIAEHENEGSFCKMHAKNNKNYIAIHINIEKSRFIEWVVRETNERGLFLYHAEAT